MTTFRASDLRTWRLQAGLTQSELAERMKLGAGGQVTVSRWEHGVRRMSAPHVELARFVLTAAGRPA